MNKITNNPFMLILFLADMLDIRLADEATSEGRLEMSYKDQWIPVCNDGGQYDDSWSFQAVWVACRQLGYYGGRPSYVNSLSIQTSFTVNDVRCGEGELKIRPVSIKATDSLL